MAFPIGNPGQENALAARYAEKKPRWLQQRNL